MSTDLPTEEDVLAHLVLHAARPVMTNRYATAQLDERDAWNAAVADLNPPGEPRSVIAGRRLKACGSLEAAIADSERRLEVERQRDAVIDEAFAWLVTGSPTGLIGTLHQLRIARARAGVSRHGG